MNESKKLANEEVQQVQEQISNYLEDSGHSVLTQSTKLTAPWINVKFSDVISSVTNGVGGKQTKDGIGIPVTRIETIANQTIDFDKVGFIADYDISKIDKYLLNQGDILFSHINSPLHLGKTAIFKENKPLYHGINLLRIVTKANVMNPYYFNYHCKLLRSQSEFSMQAQHAVNQSSLNQKKLGEFEIPLPALAEQQQIAAKLDELLAQVDNLKTRLDTIPKILKRFRQSVLAAAVSGKLTEDWRIENALCNWLETNIGEVAIVSTGKTPIRAETDYWENGTVPWLTSAITGKEFCYEAEQFVTEVAVKKCSLKIFKSGTLLLAMYGEGKTRGQVTELKLSAACNQACAAIIVDENKALRSFIKLRLLENYEETRKTAAGGNQPNLNLNKVRDIPVLLPPIEEQTEIVDRVEQLFTYAEQIEQRVKDAQARVNHLTQAILAKAFSGELTADWRAQNPKLISGDNSAAALLARIKAERETIAKPKKTGKKAQA